MWGTEVTDPTANEMLDKAVRRIVESYQPEKIILFGSYAYGQPQPDSDFDLLIIKESNDRPIDRRIHVRMLLQPLKVRPVVSPIVLTPTELERRLSMGDQFAQEIVARGRTLYERN